MTIRVYERISTEDQSVRSQRHEIERWLRSQDESEPVVWYRDEGYSRLTVAGRPDWTRLQAEMDRDDLVVFYSLDRSVVDLLDYLNVRKAFRARKVGYWFIRESLGWKPGQDANPIMDCIEEVLASFGKLETRIRQARQAAGIAAVRARNDGKCTWGGRKVGTRIKVTVEREQTIRDLAAAGKAIAQIARVVGLTRKTVYRVLGAPSTPRNDTPKSPRNRPLVDG